MFVSKTFFRTFEALGRFFNNFPASYAEMTDNICFSNNPAEDLGRFLGQKKYSKIMVLVDVNTRKHCLPVIAQSLGGVSVIEVANGEEHKTLDTCEEIWQAMTDQHLDRHAVLIILGGGVLGDMGGFCAATYKRGIDFILIPTTLLSQVDASIGGKLGVDFNAYKNHIGVFQIPVFTLLHSGFLKTLPHAEIRSGYAEVIKHTLIADSTMWDIIKTKTLTQQDWHELIRHSVDIKSKVVKEDPRESGLRKILNAGHTIGHAIESYLLDYGRKIMHGEAIAAGLIAENYIATERNLLSRHSLDEIKKYIISVFGKIELQENDLDAIAQLTLQDKKNKGNKVLCVLLEGVGKARWDCEISLDEVKRALSFYRALQI
jgi:3-dehydroquinate synthase